MKSQEMAMPVYLMHKPLIHTIEQVSISILQAVRVATQYASAPAN